MPYIYLRKCKKTHLLQQPFPDGDDINGEDAFCYMLLVVTSDDDGSLQGEYLMKRHEVGDFTAAGFLVVVKYCCKDSDNCLN